MEPPDLTTGGAQLDLVRATLRHAIESTSYYKEAFDGLDVSIESLEALRDFPLLSRETLAERATELLAQGAVPEYAGLTSGTTFGEGGRKPLLHYQAESEHIAWMDIYKSIVGKSKDCRPLMLRLTDADRGVEVAGAFPGCFSLPLENQYHFELVLAVLRDEWSFNGLTKRVRSLSGPLDALQVLTLLCVERGLDPKQFDVDVVTSSGWQLTGRWRRMFESFWTAEVQEVYGLSEAPGLFATRCANCSHYHFSKLSLVEALELDSAEPVTTGVGRVIVTCLLPIARTQPIVRYDTGDVIDILGECDDNGFGFEYLGRRSAIVFSRSSRRPYPLLFPAIINELLDPIPDIGVYKTAKSKLFDLRVPVGFPCYRLQQAKVTSGTEVELTVELRWSPLHYPASAQALHDRLVRMIYEAAPQLEAAVADGSIGFRVQLAEPGMLTRKVP